MKNCIYCGREMKYPTITQKLCSRECRRKYRSNYTKNRYNLPQVREWYKQYHQNKKKSLCGIKQELEL